MTSPNTSPLHEEIWAAVQQMNQASRTADLARLRQLVHEDMVVVPPGFQQRAAGRDVYLSSVKEFASHGTVQAFEELDPSIDVFGSTAVVTYRYDSLWESGGKEVREYGRDLLVLVRENERWVVAWFTRLPTPSTSSGA